jgi:adenylate kinase family enzyme
VGAILGPFVSDLSQINAGELCVKRDEAYKRLMRRVLVIGSGGSGKSTVAVQLGELLNLEVNHLDKLYWSAGWVKPAPDEWLKTVTDLIDGDTWIIDGNYSGTLELRLRKSDTIVFLDLPRVLCLWRIVKRFFLYRKESRPDIAEGCHENLNLEFVSWVWNYHRRSRPKVIKLLQEHAKEKQIVWLRSRNEVKTFLAGHKKAQKAQTK